MFKAFSFSNATAGLVAVMVGFTSSIAIVFQAATAAGATPAVISSWLLALGVGMAITCIGFSFYYRIPILTAWSTPGAALLVTSLSGVSMPEAIGAFIFSAILVFLSGITGLFAKVMVHIPRSITAAMLAGILLQFGTHIFVAMQSQFLIVCSLFIIYLIGKRLFPRFVILLLLLVGILLVTMKGMFHPEHIHISLSAPLFTAPTFSLSAFIGIAIPLFIVTMTSQNMPGIAVMQASGYQPAISSIISWMGAINLVLAPFGGFSINLAAITAAICVSKEADPDPTKRYKAAIFAGIFYLLIGLFGATVVALFSAFPKELVLAIAGLALLSTIGSSLKIALEDDAQREAALITLLVSASGISLFGIGAAFWGLVAGIFSLILGNSSWSWLLQKLTSIIPANASRRQLKNT
ncbi:benzoate/H(+) symporter BenE family transporter [soil metagenome]